MFASYQLPPKSDHARAFPAKQADFDFQLHIEDDNHNSYRPDQGNGWRQVSSLAVVWCLIGADWSTGVQDEDARSTSNSFLGAPAVSDAGSRPDSGQ